MRCSSLRAEALPRAARRPAGFDRAAEAAAGDAAAAGAGEAGGGSAGGARGQQREGDGSGSESDDGLPPLEANNNRRQPAPDHGSGGDDESD